MLVMLPPFPSLLDAGDDSLPASLFHFEGDAIAHAKLPKETSVVDLIDGHPSPNLDAYVAPALVDLGHPARLSSGPDLRDHVAAAPAVEAQDHEVAFAEISQEAPVLGAESLTPAGHVGIESPATLVHPEDAHLDLAVIGGAVAIG
ncbi:MAG TPA: hypothetical protein VI198_04805 [Candidatus Eisenbacteria bacterium]